MKTFSKEERKKHNRAVRETNSQFAAASGYAAGLGFASLILTYFTGSVYCFGVAIGWALVSYTLEKASH